MMALSVSTWLSLSQQKIPARPTIWIFILHVCLLPLHEALPDSWVGPTFTSRFSKKVTYLNTEGAVVPCSAYGNPFPRIEWIESNGTQISRSDGALEVLSNGSICFHAFRDEYFRIRIHSRRLRCRAQNQVGSIISEEIHVRPVLVRRYEIFNVYANDVHVSINGTAVLHCSVNPYHVTEQVQVLSWKQNNKDIKSGGRYSVLTSGHLHIRNVNRDDSGNLYSCKIRNLVTKEEKSSGNARIIVVEPVSSLPILSDLPSSVTTEQGSNIELPCVATAFPLPVYRWSKNGISIITAGQTRVLQNGGNLLITQAESDDAGTYKCMAENSLGHHSATIRLEVTAPLLLYIEPQKQLVDMGTSATFQCNVAGLPVKRIRWYHDGEPVIYDRVMLDKNDTILVIQKVLRSDAGMYQCMVTNDDDRAQASAQLTVSASKPYIYEHFQALVTQAGPRVSLRCAVVGTPAPVVTWTLDGSSLPVDDRIVISNHIAENGDIISMVNVTGIQLQDGGLYRCTAENEHGADLQEARIDIYGVPFVRPMKNVTAVANNALRLQCYVTGYPIHTITWLKGNTRLPINHRQHVSSNGTLVLSAVDPVYDEGVYSCDARDSNGHGSRQSVYIHVMDPPKVDPFSFLNRKQGNRVSVSCVMSSGDLPVTIAWQKDGGEIASDLGIQIQQTGSYSSLLSIESVSPIHNGNYTCRVTNAVASTSHTAILHVSVPPKWVKEPENSEAVLNQDIVIDCKATGDPEPYNVWKKDVAGQRGNYQDLFGVETRGDRIVLMPNGSLLIQKVVKTDDGFYLCQVTNAVSPDLSKVVQLTVNVPARAIVREKNLTATRGHVISLECNATGNVPLSIAWSFNRESIDWYDSKYQLSYFDTENGRGSKLLISPASRVDGGTYICTTQNMFGSHFTSTDVLFLEPPDPPSNLMLSEAGSRSLQLHWAVPFDGNCPITGFLVELNNLTDGWPVPVMMLEVNSSIQSVTIDKLLPATTYCFRVTAKNDVGLSEPSNLLNFTTEEEEPSGPPTNIKVVATGSQALRLSWEPPLEELRNGRILGYYVGFKKNGTRAPYIYITKTSDETFCELENLDKFVHYAIHIQSFTGKGPGPKSDDVVVLTLEDVPSQAPDGIQADAISSQDLVVSWLPPPLYALNGILQGYRVICKLVRDDEDESDGLLITTGQLSAVIHGLQKFSNYSVQVLAYTHVGDGTRSSPIYVMTQQDVPDIPADIRALAAGVGRVLVVWRPPLHPNGVIVKYTLDVRDLSSDQSEGLLVEMTPGLTSHMLENLSINHQFSIRVKASTVMGDGPWTREVKVSTVNQVSARIASFSGPVYVFVKDEVMLPCHAVGTPQPKITWRNRNHSMLLSSSKLQILSNGSLVIFRVEDNDTGDYICRAENDHGADEITFSVFVRAPPQQPVLSITTTTSKSIQVKWHTGSNGGSRIQGFYLHYRHDNAEWTRVELGPSIRTYLADDLRCGSQHSFYVITYNENGEELPSQVVTGTTNGSAPIFPPQSLILDHVNATFAVLSLDTWQTGGCPLQSFSIEYQVMGDYDVWNTVENNIPPNVSSCTVPLRPATWYLLKVSAYNSAGVTECILKFSTKPYSEAAPQPVQVVHRFTALSAHHKMYFLVPLTAAVVSLTIIILAIALYCRQRKKGVVYQSEKSCAGVKAEMALLKNCQNESALETQIYVPSPGQVLKLERSQGEANAGKELNSCCKGTVSGDNVLEEEMHNSHAINRHGNGLHGNSPLLLYLDIYGEENDEDGETINPYATFPDSGIVKPSDKLTSPTVEQITISDTATTNHVHHQNYENTTNPCENTEKTDTLGEDHRSCSREGDYLSPISCPAFQPATRLGTNSRKKEESGLKHELLLEVQTGGSQE